MKSKIRIFDKVVLLVDKPMENLRAGCVGTVNEIGGSYQDKLTFTVEFVDDSNGKVYAELYVTDASEILPLYFNLDSSLRD